MGTPGSARDTNVGFILTGIQRQRLARLLDGLVDGLPKSTSVLIDRAGRIVEIARKPLGVRLQAISALAAGCFATTNELAKAMGDEGYSLLFQHENQEQVYIWPVAERALLVVLMQGALGVGTLEQRLADNLGRDLVDIIEQAQEPVKQVPPPRVAPPEVPPEVRHRTRALTALIMDLQGRRPQDFTPEVNSGLLRAREQLVQALSRRDWRKAWELCEGTRQWLLAHMKVSQAQDIGQVLVRLYSEITGDLHKRIAANTPPARIAALYGSFYRFLAKRWPHMFISERLMGVGGMDVQAIWDAGKTAVPDSLQLATDFVPAMDIMIRDLIRVIFLAKGKEGREEALQEATGVLQNYNLELLPFGLESTVGREWTLLSSN